MSSYEEYKKEVAVQKKQSDKFYTGKKYIVGGIILLALCLYWLPLHADNIREIRCDELKKTNAYYIDNLQVLHAMVDEEKDTICCVAKFVDKDQKEWLISFTPNADEQLVKQILLEKNRNIVFDEQWYAEIDIETSGYFYLDEIPDKANTYYSVYARKYADAEGIDMLELNADYLCEAGGNYTLVPLQRLGYPLCSLLFGAYGMIAGLYLLIKYRPGKASYNSIK